MKKIFLTLLFIFLVPLLGFAEEPKVTFAPTDTLLQEKPAVIFETPYYRIKLPADWRYESIFKNNQIVVKSFSTKEKLVGILINADVGKQDEKSIKKIIDDFNSDDHFIQKEVSDSYFAGIKFTRLSGIDLNQGNPYYGVYYFSESTNFLLLSTMDPKNYEANLPFLNEIMSTLEFK